MRLIQSLLILTLGAASAWSQTSKPASQPQTSDEVKKLLMEARDMRVQQRFTDALEKLDAAEKLAPNVADIYALRGDIYLAPRRRDFELALPQFEKAAELQPDSPLPKFNLAEYYFVKHDFDTALKAFTKLTADYPKLPMVIRHLVHYKRALCELKLGHRPAAEKIVADTFTFMDDTPAYYFSKSALAFDQDDKAKANEWIQRGVAVFKAQRCEPYYDAFKELRWVPDMDLAAPKDEPKQP
ncbi:tetratricopeptide repeat protein [Prosthecobacter sp.]|uniref:tetratricopeptide repeat protein n=1 Tax=Prosthecobacter sp. TaxID=1965333 RepID=UPI001D97395F|nr:tetratricopeptide repeat protein [Prosthecobacter sp.]MCB1276197.1 tetratricopeptide repeat protein [Prosthecobacter sp.]